MARDTIANKVSHEKLCFILDLMQDEIEVNKLMDEALRLEDFVAYSRLKDVLRAWRRNAAN